MANGRSRGLKVVGDGARQELAAGAFSVWLREIRGAQVGGGTARVPCGECTACCRSSYFVHIGLEETETLARIPKELQFRAPGLPAGNVVLGYDDNGCCPMFIDGRCSIYEHRPQACRTYDCRVFPATGIEADEEDKILVARQAKRWKFAHPTKRDRREQEAVRAAARFLREHEDSFEGGLPRSSTQLANLAIKACQVFLGDEGASGPDGPARTNRQIAEAIMEAGANK